LMICTAKKINHVNLVFHCCRNILQIEAVNSKKCTCLHTLAICSQTSNESHASQHVLHASAQNVKELLYHTNA
jgi:hypothetical protein